MHRSSRGNIDARLPPVPGQELIELVDGVRGDACQDIGEPSLRVDVVELTGLCRPPNYAERFWEQPIVGRICPPVERITPQYHSA
jgi:hypothetical protein